MTQANDDAPRTHRWSRPVVISDLDAYGHTNHTAFLSWLEEGRERFLRDRGLSFLSFLEQGTPLVMVRLEVDYKGQVRWGDAVEIETGVERLGRTSVTFAHRVTLAGGTPAVFAKVVMVFVDREGRPTQVPQEAAARLQMRTG